MRERKVQRTLLILAPLFFMINSPVTGVVITQVPVPVTTTRLYFCHIVDIVDNGCQRDTRVDRILNLF